MNKYEFYDKIKTHITNVDFIDKIPKSVDLNKVWECIKIKFEEYGENIKILKIETNYNTVIKEFFKYESNNTYLSKNDIIFNGVYRKSLCLIFEKDGTLFNHRFIYPDMIEIPEILLSKNELEIIEKFKEPTWIKNNISCKIKSLIYNNFKLGYTWRLTEIEFDPTRELLSSPPQKCYNAIFTNHLNESISLKLI